MKTRILLAISLLAFAALGCSTDPRAQAGEVRAIYKEAQTQLVGAKEEVSQQQAALAKAKLDPTVSQDHIAEMQASLSKFQAKVEDLDGKIVSAGPFIDALEVAAARAETNPGTYINFQALYVEYKPKVEAFVVSLILRRYLGV